jgi:hypothetical protein
MRGKPARNASPRQTTTLHITLEQTRGLLDLKAILRERIEDADNEQRRAVLEMMRLRVHVKDGKGVISSIFPFVSEPLDLHPSR